MTVVVLLAESHAALHTYPEHQYLSLDVYLCGDQSPKRVISAVESCFQNCRLREVSLNRIVPADFNFDVNYNNQIYVGYENYNSGDLDSSTVCVFKQIAKAIWGEYSSDNCVRCEEEIRALIISCLSQRRPLLMVTSRKRFQINLGGT